MKNSDVLFEPFRRYPDRHSEKKSAYQQHPGHIAQIERPDVPHHERGQQAARKIAGRKQVGNRLYRFRHRVNFEYDARQKKVRQKT